MPTFVSPLVADQLAMNGTDQPRPMIGSLAVAANGVAFPQLHQQQQRQQQHHPAPPRREYLHTHSLSPCKPEWCAAAAWPPPWLQRLGDDVRQLFDEYIAACARSDSAVTEYDAATRLLSQQPLLGDCALFDANGDQTHMTAAMRALFLDPGQARIVWTAGRLKLAFHSYISGCMENYLQLQPQDLVFRLVNGLDMAAEFSTGPTAQAPRGDAGHGRGTATGGSLAANAFAYAAPNGAPRPAIRRGHGQYVPPAPQMEEVVVEEIQQRDQEPPPIKAASIQPAVSKGPVDNPPLELRVTRSAAARSSTPAMPESTPEVEADESDADSTPDTASAATKTATRTCARCKGSISSDIRWYQGAWCCTACAEHAIANPVTSTTTAATPAKRQKTAGKRTAAEALSSSSADKGSTSAASTAPPRKRGRPPKDKSLVNTTTTKTGRKRGKAAGTTASVATPAASSAPAPKRRGRPPKNRPAAETHAQTQAQAQQPSKAGAGTTATATVAVTSRASNPTSARTSAHRHATHSAAARSRGATPAPAVMNHHNSRAAAPETAQDDEDDDDDDDASSERSGGAGVIRRRYGVSAAPDDDDDEYREDEDDGNTYTPGGGGGHHLDGHNHAGPHINLGQTHAPGHGPGHADLLGAGHWTLRSRPRRRTVSCCGLVDYYDEIGGGGDPCGGRSGPASPSAVTQEIDEEEDVVDALGVFQMAALPY
ncbi:hypothetical protein V8E36_003186 [Tilletia maclaganii]